MDCSDSDLEETRGTAMGKIVVMAEPVSEICSVSKIDFNVNYFKMLRRKRLEKLYGVINLSDSDNEAEEIHLMIAKLTAEEATNLQKQKEEITGRQKGKRIVGPFRAAESGGNGKSVIPKTHRVNLGLTPEEIDLVEGWVEYVRELSRGNEDPDAEPEKWTCSEYPSELSISNFNKLRGQYRILESVRDLPTLNKERPLTGLSLKGGEKNQDASPVFIDPRQTTLVHIASPQGLQIMVQKKELGAKRMDREKVKEVGSEVGASSRPSVENDKDAENLENIALIRKAKK
ncbi:hypothetical protein Fot_05303 [Forsythia ovata]|uniref:Uncharacterized protein n=1 Tax=Forsythia ovata TaxID=205694 RepID=A0ABD1WPR0_9LAMI